MQEDIAFTDLCELCHFLDLGASWPLLLIRPLSWLLV